MIFTSIMSSFYCDDTFTLRASKRCCLWPLLKVGNETPKVTHSGRRGKLVLMHEADEGISLNVRDGQYCRDSKTSKLDVGFTPALHY